MDQFKSVKDAFLFLESFTNLEKSMSFTVRNYKLDRMQTLLTMFNNPHKNFKTIHIAGSKGKGSTGIFCSSILTAAGYKTGLYSSPHVSTYKERITLSGKFLPDSVFIKLISKIRETLTTFRSVDLPADEDPTTFELLTLLAFLTFRESGCEWGVIETGIGGRLDSTNVLFPSASIITPIELEHTDILGDTLEKIAGEKAGIIKSGIPVFCSYQKDTPARVLKEKAEELDSDIFFLDDYLTYINVTLSKKGTKAEIKWKNSIINIFTLLMIGDFQAENAVLAVLALRHLSQSGICTVSEESIKIGLGIAVLPGRMELLQNGVYFLFDGAHTIESIKKLIISFKKIFPEKANCIFGSVTGKNTKEMAELLAPEFSNIIISRPGTFKKSDPEAVYKVFRKLKKDTILEIEPESALQTALKLSNGIRPILVTGSFYMVAEIRNLLMGHFNMDNT